MEIEETPKELTSTQIRLNNLSDEEINNQIDSAFPMKDSAGFPTYRQYQKGSIFNAIKAFKDGARCVMIDGPVGSGKSVINYTIGRVMGSAVYLTPQKMLQDQISKEDWSRTKTVKGRNAYLCNYCRDEHGATITCDYTGDQHKMCRNAEELAPHPYGDDDIEQIRRHIMRSLKAFKTDEVKRRKYTSFEPSENTQKIFEEIKKYIEAHSGDDGDDRPVRIGLGEVAQKIGCKFAPIECSVKSARMMSKIYDMRILNPDVFFMLIHNNPDYFGNIDLMIADECHSFESVINRIFSTKIPISAMAAMFGINLYPLLDCTTSESFAEEYLRLRNSDLIPLMAAAKVFVNMADVIKAHSDKHIDAITSQTEYANIIRQAKASMSRVHLQFSILNLSNVAFTNRIDEFVSANPNYVCLKSFMECARRDFIAQISKKMVVDQDYYSYDFITSFKKPVMAAMGNHFINEYKPVEEINVMNYAVETMEAMEPMVDKLNQMIDYKHGQYRIFIFKKDKETGDKACKNSDFEQLSKTYSIDGGMCDYVEVIPANIGSLLNYAFFRYANHLLLSTGTWVDWRGMIKTFGLDPDKDVKYLRIPSLFDVKRRPVYVLDNKERTDFSEKSTTGSAERYVYQTISGTEKYLAELRDMVQDIRAFIGTRRSIDPASFNIVVHTHSFGITRTIAEKGYVDDSWLFHLGGDLQIRNLRSGQFVDSGYKDDLIGRMMSSPDSGLVFVSPSITEGVDFKNGIARAQIILKMPIPYAMDPYVRLRADGNKELGIGRDPDFFTRQIMTTICQEYGRVVRSETDWGYTFTFDQKITAQLRDLLNVHQRDKLARLNIKYFTEAIKYYNDEYGRAVFEWPL